MVMCCMFYVLYFSGGVVSVLAFLMWAFNDYEAMRLWLYILVILIMVGFIIGKFYVLQ